VRRTIFYFSSDGRGGLGGYDIFSTKLDAQGRPGKITNLGEPANSSQDDFWIYYQGGQAYGVPFFE
jgi:hypothetical protein